MTVKHLEQTTSNGQATSLKKMATKDGSPTLPALRVSAKIRDRHWERLAIVYIRQSSPHQVLENRESRERQYALAELAQQFGWPADRVLITVTEASTKKIVDAGIQYLASYKDDAGQWLDGAKTYELVVPRDVPMLNFWSVVLYR
jgi:hypothetical protein